MPTWVTADDIKQWLTAEDLVADSVKVIRNHETQESKGFAFVEMQSIAEAQRAVEVLHDQEFARFAREVPGPLLANMTEFGKSQLLDFDALAGLGYRMVLYPLTAFRSALRAAHDTLAELLRKGHQRERLPQMLTRAELYELLGYSGYEARDRAYFG